MSRLSGSGFVCSTAAPYRQVRRKMEEENKKARKAERREYNDTVRELVAFIRKRVGVGVETGIQ